MCCGAEGGAAHALLSSPGRGARRAIFEAMTVLRHGSTALVRGWPGRVLTGVPTTPMMQLNGRFTD